MICTGATASMVGKVEAEPQDLLDLNATDLWRCGGSVWKPKAYEFMTKKACLMQNWYWNCYSAWVSGVILNTKNAACSRTENAIVTTNVNRKFYSVLICYHYKLVVAKLLRVLFASENKLQLYWSELKPPCDYSLELLFCCYNLGCKVQNLLFKDFTDIELEMASCTNLQHPYFKLKNTDLA